MKIKQVLLVLRRGVSVSLFLLWGICFASQIQPNNSLSNHVKPDSILFVKSSNSTKFRIKGSEKYLILDATGSGLDTLRNHDGVRASPFRTCSLYRATRLTMPNNSASACTIKTVRFAFQHYTYAACPCSLYIWRDTIVSGMHRPGSVRYHIAITVPSDAPGDWSWYYHDLSSVITFNPNENFWIGSIHLTRDVAQCVDGSDNPDTTRNEYRYSTSRWYSNHTDYFMEAVVRYIPLDNNIGTLGIEGIEKVVSGGTSSTIKARVKNFGHNILSGGIPVILKITGPTTYSDTEFTSLLLGDSTQLITFQPNWSVPFSVGDYQVVVWTNFANDPIRSNDTVTLPVFVYTRGHRETFDDRNFPPPGWAIFNFNGINQWSRDTFQYYTAPSGASIYYDQTPYAPNNDWLVSPRLFAQRNESIIFWYRARFSQYMETLLVRISYASNLDTVNFVTIDRIATNNTNWQRRIIPLNLSQDDSILIAFDYPSYNKSSICLDDIIIPEPVRFIDFFPVRIDAPLLPIIEDSTYRVAATYKDNSIDEGVIDLRVYYQISGSSTYWRDSAVIENMGSGDMPTINFRNFTPLAVETLQFKIWTSYTGDEDPADDTIIRYVVVSPYSQILPYAEDFNEDWGPYGDNPPFSGWRIIDNGSEYNKTWNTNDWYKDTCRVSDTKLREVAKVFYSPREDQMERLISPRLNCSNPGIYNFSYWHWYLDRSSSQADSGLILISNNDGTSWTTIARYSNASDSGAKTYNITSYVTGYPKVRICYLYGAYNEYWWCIDDFSVIWIPYGPVLLEPSNGFTSTNPTVFFNWQPISGVSSYEFEIGYDSLFQMIMLDDTLADNSTSVTFEPANYWWRARTAEPVGLWSEIRRLTILPPPPPPVGWFQLNPLLAEPSARTVKDGGALTFDPIDSCVYALKGNNTREFYAYKINDSSWTIKDSIGLDPLKTRKAKKGATLCYGNGLIYATKGNSSNEFWAYNPFTNIWVEKRNIPGTGAGLRGGTGLVYVLSENGKGKLVNEPQHLSADEKNLRLNSGSKDGDRIYLLKGGTKAFFEYFVSSDSWILKDSAPGGPKKKKFMDGSGLVFDGNSKIYALKGGAIVNEFYYYDLTADTWSLYPGDTIPKADSNFARVKKKTVKDGGGLAFLDNKIYAIKGGGCVEFWCYSESAGQWKWRPLDTIPHSDQKGVPKTGAALTAGLGSIYLLKGNNTREFWHYLPELFIKSSKQISSATIENTLSNPVSIQTRSKFEIVPNPCRTVVNIRFTSSKPAQVSIRLYNVNGELVETFHNGLLYNGVSNIRLPLKNLRAGIYFLNFDNSEEKRIAKLIVQ
jgi:hypothetical protein